MRIRMTATMAGPAGVRHDGSIHEVEDEEAAELIDGGYAVNAALPAAVAEDDAFVGVDLDAAIELKLQELEDKLASLTSEKAAMADIADKLAVENKALTARVQELEAAAAASATEPPAEKSETPPVETATAPPAPETATQPRSGGQGGSRTNAAPKKK